METSHTYCRTSKEFYILERKKDILEEQVIRLKAEMAQLLTEKIHLMTIFQAKLQEMSQLHLNNIIP